QNTPYYKLQKKTVNEVQNCDQQISLQTINARKDTFADVNHMKSCEDPGDV
ncbi:MAG: hypothetical protein JWL70_78, partial [Acidimicrobiia bacterium]|nr:hypothetical protein [Acidimicrobiia bacterium]